MVSLYQWDDIPREHNKQQLFLFKGKQGTVTEVTSAAYGTLRFIKKQFNNKKSITSFLKEIEYQRRASEIGVSPKIIDFCLNPHQATSTLDKIKGWGSLSVGPYVIMEKRGINLCQYLEKQGKIYETQLQQINELYNKLDSIGIQHNDANLGNIVVVDNAKKPHTFQLIDFGMATATPGKNNDASKKLLKIRIQRELGRH